MHRYQAFENLRQHKAQLREKVRLGSGMELAAWTNKHDTITQCCDHHTLSLYVADGYETYHKTPYGWRNGGGPDRFCLMPQQCESTWDVRSDLSFVHLYCTDEHLKATALQIWDKAPAQLNLDEQTFGEDPRITALYRHCLLACDWQQPANQLLLSTSATLLLTHLIQHYSQVNWQLPTLRGGLAPVALRRVQAYVEANLDAPLTLGDLAAQAGLSEYHFARMFKQTTGLAPHQFVMLRRLAKARELLRHTPLPLTEIALACGFASPSHFSNRFRASEGVSPSAWRRQAR